METVCGIGLFVAAVGVSLVSVPIGVGIVAGVFLVPAAGGAIWAGVTIIRNIWKNDE